MSEELTGLYDELGETENELQVIAQCSLCKRGYVYLDPKRTSHICMGCGGRIVELDYPVAQSRWDESRTYFRTNPTKGE